MISVAACCKLPPFGRLIDTAGRLLPRVERRILFGLDRLASSVPTIWAPDDVRFMPLKIRATVANWCGMEIHIAWFGLGVIRGTKYATKIH